MVASTRQSARMTGVWAFVRENAGISLSGSQCIAEPLGPDSLVWQLGCPRTGLLVAGRSLVLQTAHPVVGAAVRDHSDFVRDPWSRLDKTVRSMQLQLFGGPASLVEAERLRELHRTIRGTGFSGERYSALDPEAYAWVHLSNFDTTLAFHRWFAPPLGRGEQVRLYDEWRRLGLILGIRDSDMPADVDECRAYVHDMVTGTLTDNETVRTLLASLRLSGVGSPWRFLPEPVWRVLRPFSGSILYDATVGTLPAALHETLGLRWNGLDQRRLQAAAAVVRAVSGSLPDWLTQYPEGARARREARHYSVA
jgi:uncharacterized protein (DUF2236 family)